MRTQNTVKYGTIPPPLILKWQNWKEMILNSGEFSACFLLIWVKWSFGCDGGRCWPKNCKSMIKFHYYEEVGWGGQGRREDSHLHVCLLAWTPHYGLAGCPGLTEWWETGGVQVTCYNTTPQTYSLPSVSQLEETNNTERGQGQPGDSELIKQIIWQNYA